MKPNSKRLLKTLLLILGIGAALLILIEVILSSKMVTRTVNKYAAEYIDGDIRFGDISVSILRQFPYASLTLEDFSVTYPADRFDQQERLGAQGHLMHHGCGETADTLASFRQFNVSISPLQLLFNKIHIPEIVLVSPRVFAHAYADGNANWNIFATAGEQGEIADSTTIRDTSTVSAPETEASFPRISVGRIRLRNHPHIVYTDSRDTVFAMVDMKQAGFNGRLITGKTTRNRIGMHIDSVFIAGRVANDTLAIGLDKLHIDEHGRSADFVLEAKTLAATRTFGRFSVPVGLKGSMHFVRDTVPAIAVENLTAEIAAVPISGEVQLRFMKGRTGIDGQVSVNGAEINDILKRFVTSFVPEAGKIGTDAVIYMNASCKSEYIHGSGKLPECQVEVNIPDSYVRYTGFPQDIRVAIGAAAEVNRKGTVNLKSGKAQVTTEGMKLNAKAKAQDCLGKDPYMEIEGELQACLDSLVRFLPDTTGIKASGDIKADIKGKARLSQLDIYSFSHTELLGSLSADKILFNSPADTIDIDIQGLDMKLGPENLISRRDSTKSFRLMGITAAIGSADISMKESLEVNGKRLMFSAKNSTDNDKDTSSVQRLGGRLQAENLSVTDRVGTSLKLDNTKNSFMMMPKRSSPQTPVLSVTSRNKRITLITTDNRVILTDAAIKAKAAMNTIERRQKVRNFMDSLAMAHPDIPRDSLMQHLRSKRKSAAMTAWMTEEDFRKSDISITLDESMRKYFRDWDLEGNLNVRTGILMTPYFPIRNILRGCEISFTNDRVAIDSLKFMSGSSELTFRGEMKGLRRAVLRKGMIKLGLDISSDGMNANELLGAFNAGSSYNPKTSDKEISGISNADFFQMVTVDTVTTQKNTSLLVIPANIYADISLEAGNIRYSDLLISRLHSDLTMKERCVQITNTMATSNIGEVVFEGFYATRTKKDIQAGFNINFKDITAEKAISLMPAVDTIMPLLKSFAGNLNCDLAATARLDTNMNIITPSINGVMRISGNDLTISDSDLFTGLARKLKFNNKKVGTIRQMTVEGVIKDNMMEVFPFVLNLDRYTLALSGKQNLDMSFRYHASIIRSPIIIKLGVDLYGSDFDHLKFKIGRPKYKDENVPVFSTVIDQTKINLAESIRNIFVKGVDAAVKENERQEELAKHKKDIGYVNAVDQTLEELSEEDKLKLEQETAEDTVSDTTEEAVGEIEATRETEDIQ